MSESDDKTHAYRDGFLNGARAVLKAIGDDLPEIQMRVLKKWVDGPLADWVGGPTDAEQPAIPAIDGA